MHYEVRLSAGLICPETGDFGDLCREDSCLSSLPDTGHVMPLKRQKEAVWCAMLCSCSREVQCHLKAQGIFKISFQRIPAGWPTHKGIEEVNQNYQMCESSSVGLDRGRYSAWKRGLWHGEGGQKSECRGEGE